MDLLTHNPLAAKRPEGRWFSPTPYLGPLRTGRRLHPPDDEPYVMNDPPHRLSGTGVAVVAGALLGQSVGLADL